MDHPFGVPRKLAECGAEAILQRRPFPDRFNPKALGFPLLPFGFMKCNAFCSAWGIALLVSGDLAIPTGQGHELRATFAALQVRRGSGLAPVDQQSLRVHVL